MRDLNLTKEIIMAGNTYKDRVDELLRSIFTQKMMEWPKTKQYFSMLRKGVLTNDEMNALVNRTFQFASIAANEAGLKASEFKKNLTRENIKNFFINLPGRAKESLAACIGLLAEMVVSAACPRKNNSNKTEEFSTIYKDYNEPSIIVTEEHDLDMLEKADMDTKIQGLARRVAAKGAAEGLRQVASAKAKLPVIPEGPIQDAGEEEITTKSRGKLSNIAEDDVVGKMQEAREKKAKRKNKRKPKRKPTPGTTGSM